MVFLAGVWALFSSPVSDGISEAVDEDDPWRPAVHSAALAMLLECANYDATAMATTAALVLAFARATARR